MYKFERIKWFKDSEDDERIKERGYKQTYVYRAWMCRGCETHKFEIGINEPGMKEGTFNCTFYPEFLDYQLPAKSFRYLDPKFDNIYHEIISCFNNQLFLSCAIMLRCLIEGLCQSYGIDDKKAWKLKEKLKLLGKKTGVHESVIKALNELKIMGDSAAHRMNITSKDELTIGIQIVECLLDHFYESKEKLDKKAKELTKTNKIEKQINPNENINSTCTICRDDSDK